MKNIYLLPTGKATRGLVLLNSIYRIEKGLINYPKDLYPDAEGYDVYITSDEEIKDGDRVYCKHLNCILQFKNPSNRHFYKKIILTTDQDLIKDGVQAIDDEFLEWFIKNPSCEFVEIDEKSSDEIEKELGIYGHDIGLTESEYNEWLTNGGQLYKIIIPKEEDFELVSIGEETIKLAIPMIQDKEDTKQETLEEAAERLYPTTINSFTDSGFDTSETERLIFKNGAKWQQEQNKNLYSEEDMIEFADFYYQYKELIKLNNWETIEVSKEYVFKKWIEQLITL